MDSGVILYTVQPSWKSEYLIRSYHVDVHGEAKLAAMGWFMQETASYHASKLRLGYEHLEPKNMAWVLARQRIQVESMPRMGDSVAVETWPSGIDRLFFYRDFRVSYADGHDLLRATTAWFVIDLATRKRQSPDAFLEQEFPLSEPLFDARPGRLRGTVPKSPGEPFRVCYGDLDFNEHVTNVRYLEWLLDGVPLDYHRGHRLREIEANYLSEAVHGERIEVRREAASLEEFTHAILETGGGREVLRARTVWRHS